MGTPHGGVDETSPVRNHSPRQLRLWKLLVPGMLAATVLAPVTPASAQVAYGAAVDFLPPTPGAGAPLTGVQHLKAQATGLVIRSLTLIIRSDDPSIPAFETRADEGPSIRQQVVELDWDTRRLTYNGIYRFDASAEACGPAGCSVVNASRTGILVANPPATPAGVHAAFQNNVPVVSWQAGGEADLLGYQVVRSSSGGPEAIGSVTAGKPTTFADPSAPAGVGVTYSVAAVRRSPIATGAGCGSLGSRCIVSAPSAPTPMLATPALGPPPPADGGYSAPPGSNPAPAAPPAAPPQIQPNPAPPATRGNQNAQPPPAKGQPTAPAPAAPAVPVVPVPPTDPALAPPPDVIAPQVEGFQAAPPASPQSPIAAHDRVDTSKPDKTAAVLTFILLALGFYGAYRAKSILLPRKQ
jgi:hypothetical protein